MTPSIALPAPRPTLTDRLRPHKSQLFLGAFLGLAAELLLDGTAYGLGHALFAVLAAGAVVAHAGREAWQTAGEHRWLLVGSVLLLSSTMLHDATWLSNLSTLSALLLFALALQGWNGERSLSHLRTGQLLAAPFRTFGQSLHAGSAVTARELKDTKVTTAVQTHAPAAFRLAFIVVPPALILTALLSSGDAVFAARLDGLVSTLFGLQLDGAVRGGLVTAVAGLVFTGVLALASRRREAITPSAPTRRLKSFEAFALLGTLTSLLFFFGVTSTPCALAPASCALPAGVTYSEAANDGFFQLLTAALGILALLMALPARTHLSGRGQWLTFTAMSTGLVLATLPMIVSGVVRLSRYEDVYGLTVLRLMAYAGLFLVAAVLGWRALTLWAFQDAFVGGALGLCTVTMLGLAALSPDAFIARQNVKRPVVDVAYLLLLSDDALPAIAIASPHLDDPPYVSLQEVLRYRAQRHGAAEPLLTWNLGRARTAEALAALRQ